MKRIRTTFTNDQLNEMETIFKSGVTYPTTAYRAELSHQLNLPDKTVKIWFQNRRIKAKKDAPKSLRSDSAYTSHSPSSHISTSPLHTQVTVKEVQVSNQQPIGEVQLLNQKVCENLPKPNVDPMDISSMKDYYETSSSYLAFQSEHESYECSNDFWMFLNERFEPPENESLSTKAEHQSYAWYGLYSDLELTDSDVY